MGTRLTDFYSRCDALATKFQSRLMATEIFCVTYLGVSKWYDTCATFASFLYASLLGFAWKRVAIKSGPNETKGPVNEKTRDRTPDRKAWARCPMPPNTLRLQTEYVYIKSFTCRNCGGGDRVRVAIYRPFGEVSLSLNRTVTCMVLKANDRRTSCPCHDEFRGPRSDYIRQRCCLDCGTFSKTPDISRTVPAVATILQQGPFHCQWESHTYDDPPEKKNSKGDKFGELEGQDIDPSFSIH
ncbi:uncharacterized protein TNCV_4368251 [Trichonephila clavipes]|nr:uncharacterized protein TNCV_4368251 [Trichonephila clavipes]